MVLGTTDDIAIVKHSILPSSESAPDKLNYMNGCDQVS